MRPPVLAATQTSIQAITVYCATEFLARGLVERQCGSVVLVEFAGGALFGDRRWKVHYRAREEA